MISTRTKSATFLHNGDFSGNVEIVVKSKRVSIPFEDIKGLVAEYVRRERIQAAEVADDMKAIKAAESASDNAILGII